MKSFLPLFCLLAVSGVLLSSCASSLSDINAPHSQAFQKFISTTHGRELEKEVRKHSGKSGFALVPYGQDAFEKRMRMISLAEKSLDIQYYIWKVDTTGNLLTYQILKAADRGVKVRLLLDDLGLKGRDKVMSALDAHPNIEIRVFNPFASRNNRGLNFLLDFDRLNHRMHNKVMVADNALAITGGRNVGDHYFSVSKEGNFRDLDVICTGPVVREISEVHDYFWNGKWSVPIHSLTGNSYTEKHLAKARVVLEKLTHKSPSPYPLDLGRPQLISNLTSLRGRMIWAHGSYIWNDPVELKRSKEFQKDTIIRKLRRISPLMKQDMLIESPYFIPGDRGVVAFKDLVERGVKVRILTNSLRSNDVIPSHAGYARYRKDLILAGVELYELRPDAIEGNKKSPISFSGSKNAGLHTKAFVFDRRAVFVGSFNLDPRSALINSEGGLFIESKELAREVTRYMNADISPKNSYCVTMDAKGKLLWTTEIDGKTVVFHSEPDNSIWTSFLIRVIQMLPIEDQL